MNKPRNKIIFGRIDPEIACGIGGGISTVTSLQLGDTGGAIQPCGWWQKWGRTSLDRKMEAKIWEKTRIEGGGGFMIKSKKWEMAEWQIFKLFHIVP